METVIGLTSLLKPVSKKGLNLAFLLFMNCNATGNLMSSNIVLGQNITVCTPTCQHNALKYFGIFLLVPYVTVQPHFLKSCPKAHSRRLGTAVSYFMLPPRILILEH